MTVRPASARSRGQWSPARRDRRADVRGHLPQSAGATTAALGGGVYPNGLDTTYYWQYGTTTSYGAQTGPIDTGSGQAPVAATVRWRASPPAPLPLPAGRAERRGVAYGYDSELTTEPAPVNTMLPSVGGLDPTGHTSDRVSGRVDSERQLAHLPVAAFERRCQWTSIGGATGGAYTIGAGDGGDHLRLVVTATNSYGQSTVASAAGGPRGRRLRLVDGAGRCRGSPRVRGSRLTRDVSATGSRSSPPGGLDRPAGNSPR